jgi:hypothetical protein
VARRLELSDRCTHPARAGRAMSRRGADHPGADTITIQPPPTSLVLPELRTPAPPNQATWTEWETGHPA